MRRDRVSMILLLAVIVAVIFGAAYGMLDQGKEEQSYSVSVIVNDSSNERWNAFREGLDQGASDNGIFVNLVSTGAFQNAKEEQTIIKRELEQGADAVIVEPYFAELDDGFLDQISQPVVFVESEANTDNFQIAVTADQEKVGQALAQAVLDGGADRVGVFCGNQKEIGMQKRLKGFEDALADSGVEIIWELTAAEREQRIADGDYFQAYQADAVVSLENDETEAAVDVLQARDNLDFQIYGVGRSEKTVYYLDKGIIAELVVPNEYYMGYQSVSAAAKELAEYSTEKSQRYDVDFVEATKENLYNDENSRILFPTVR